MDGHLGCFLGLAVWISATVKYIGIIDGVIGILLTILAIENDVKTPWDYAFSLQ